MHLRIEHGMEFGRLFIVKGSRKLFIRDLRQKQLHS